MPKVSFAQFTYVGADIAYQSAIFKGGSLGTGSSLIHSLNLNIKATYRPIRYFGLGASFAYPFFQSSKGSFYGAPDNSSERTFRDFETYYETGRTKPYKPDMYNYEFKQSFTASAFVRGFFETIVNSYAELRFSYTSLTEEFEFKRGAASASYSQYTNTLTAGALEARDIQYEDSHTLLAPGFSVGVMPHLTDHLFLDFSLGMDFWVFNQNTGFSYQIEYDWSINEKRHIIANLSSQLNGLKPVFALKLGLGYYF